MFRRRALRSVAPFLSSVLMVGVLVVAAPPPAAAIESPGGLTTTDGSARILSWDRVPGATSYDVQVARSASFSPTLASVSTVNGEYVPVVQLPVGEVWWRVRAKAGSTVGDWTTSTFSTVTAAAPIPVRPLAGATFQAPTTPLFSWEPVAGATSYTVKASPDPAFTDPDLIVSNKQKTTGAYLTSYPLVGSYYWRVQAELSTGYASAWSAPLRYLVSGLPPVTLEGPADSFVPEVTDVVLDWTPVTGAATYDLQVGTDENFLTVVHAASGVTGTRYSPPTTLDNDEYYWRVRPVDTSGNKAPWPASPWRFRRAWSAQPVPSYPQGAVDPSRPFFYQWEPIERANRYRVTLFDETGSTVCSVTTVHTTVAGACVPKTEGWYRWRVVGIDDSAGVVTDQLAQAPASFTYVPPAPVTPAPAGTLDVADVEGHRVSLTGTAAFSAAPGDTCEGRLPDTCLDLRQTPVLTWKPVPGATSYKLTLSYDRELTNVIGTYSVDQPMWTPPPSTTFADSQAGSAYFWVVQPCGVSCAPIDYPKHSFAKKMIAPRLLSPAEGEIVSDDVTLAWSSQLAALRSPGAAAGSALTTTGTMEARNYVVQTAIDRGFSAGLETVTVDQTTFTSFASTYPEGLVYWRVRALDGGGTTTVWSATGSFEKRSPVPQLLTPADGAPLAQDYTLTWDPIDFAASYDVEVYAGPTQVASVTTKYASWTPSTPFPASVDGYTWRVRRVDTKGRRGEWSPTRRFRFDGFPVSPAAPAPSEVVPPAGGRFSWLADTRASAYRFERRKPGSTDLAETVTTRATAWSPTSAMAGGTAQWRVVALDAAGQSLGSSPWRDFVVVDPPRVVIPVTITGSGAVGTELRAYAPTFDPAAVTTTYQWYRGTSAIAGATGETYAVVVADLNKTISVRATGTVPGYQSAISSSNPIGGAPGGALAAERPPDLTGTAEVGSQLTVVPGVWSGSPRLSYQWYRDGAPISRATGQTYRPSAADAARTLTVVETATLTGFQPGAATSPAVTVAKIASTAKVTLSATRTTMRKRVTATVAVTASGIAAPGGSVSVSVGKRRVKVLPLGSRTSVTLRLPKQAPGAKTVTAVYTGGAQVLGSSAKARLKVTRR